MVHTPLLCFVCLLENSCNQCRCGTKPKGLETLDFHFDRRDFSTQISSKQQAQCANGGQSYPACKTPCCQVVHNDVVGLQFPGKYDDFCLPTIQAAKETFDGFAMRDTSDWKPGV